MYKNFHELLGLSIILSWCDTREASAVTTREIINLNSYKYMDSHPMFSPSVWIMQLHLWKKKLPSSSVGNLKELVLIWSLASNIFFVIAEK